MQRNGRTLRADIGGMYVNGDAVFRRALPREGQLNDSLFVLGRLVCLCLLIAVVVNWGREVTRLNGMGASKM